MNKLKVGERVVALSNSIQGSSQDRIKGKLYTVNAVSYCSGCGVQLINTKNAFFGLPIECDCGFCSKATELAWTYSSHYASIDDLETIQTAINEAVEVEDYDSAIILRDCIIQNR